MLIYLLKNRSIVTCLLFNCLSKLNDAKFDSKSITNFRISSCFSFAYAFNIFTHCFASFWVTSVFLWLSLANLPVPFIERLQCRNLASRSIYRNKKLTVPIMEAIFVDLLIRFAVLRFALDAWFLHVLDSFSWRFLRFSFLGGWQGSFCYMLTELAQ